MADVVTVQVNNTVTGTVTQVQTVDVGYSLPSGTSLPLPSGTASAGEFPVATGSGTGTRWYPAVLYAPAPSGDTTGATDGPAVQALINALNTFGGGKVLLQPGTYWGALTLKSNVCVEGAERLATVWKLHNGANTDVIQGANFSSLTLGGTTGGISGWALRNMTIDGNRLNQSGTSHGVRIYGYDFEIACVTIRYCLTGGLYTEWAANAGGVADGMEPHYREVKIHDCSGNGWHDRGPHDARSWDVTIWAPGSTSKGYWSESSSNTTVAAGSNGTDLSAFTSGSPGTLNVATTLNFPSASISATQGALTVNTALSPVTLTYTGVTATSFTGCVAQGSPSSGSTVSTGGTVAYVGGFSAAGQLHTQMHVYAQPMYDYVLDTQTHLVDCIGEVTQAGGAMILLRAANCMITGGLYAIYPAAPQLGAGIQIGDAANPAGGNRIDTAVQGFQGVSAATAALNIVSTGSNNSIDLLVNQASGQAVFGSPGRDRIRIFTSGSGNLGTDTSNSQIQEYGTVSRFVPSTAQQAWTLASSSSPFNPAVNYRPPTNQLQFANGLTTRWYSDNFSTATGFLNGSTGQFSAAYMGATGKTGATATSNYAGATAGGAPASGTFAVGDYVVDQTGMFWICTVAGTPGTWAHAPNFGGLFGNGSDGAATLDGTATVAWATKAGSTYTMTRDAQLTSLTITGGATLKTAQFRILCQGTVNVTGTGTISNAGNAASGSTAGGVGSAGSLSGGRGGGNGGTGVSGTGTSGSNANFGTAGGAGGTGTSGAAGNGGTVTQSSTTASANIVSLPNAMLTGVAVFASAILSLQWGPGGGGGGSDASSNAGGGGGGGGGIVPIAAWALVNNGTITVAGGSGAAGTAGNAGGGGGGSAGAILTYTLSAPSGTGAYTTTGGTPGAGSGTGSAGTAGGAGLLVQTVLA